MTALPSWPQVPTGSVRARELKAGDLIRLSDVPAEVDSVELRHYYDGGSLVIPSDARIIIKATTVYGTEQTLEAALLDPIEVLN